jgi:hypothetical protein
MTNKQWRKKLLATWWGIARFIGTENTWAYTHKCYPDKIQEYPGKGLTRLTIDELETVVRGLVNMSGGQYNMPVKKTKTRGRWVPYDEKLKEPSSPGQTAKINKLANELNITDKYLVGIAEKAIGRSLADGEMTNTEAQKVIEALKHIKKRRQKTGLQMKIPYHLFEVNYHGTA